MHNNFCVACKENRLPCCNKCGHLQLRDVMGEEVKMTPSSATSMNGTFNSYSISPSVKQ